MELELLRPQSEFFEDTTTRFLGLVGGYGSGKTRSLAYKIINLAANNYGYEGIAMSPTYGMMMKVLIPTLEECMSDLGIKYTYEKAAQSITMHWGKDRNTKVHLHAAENYRRAAGLNLAFGCVDEFDLVERDEAHAAWKMIQSRLRRGRVYQLCAVSTPEGYSFMHDYFVRDAVDKAGNPKTDRRLIRASTRDNPFLPPEFIESLLRDYPSNLISAYIDGEFTNLTSGNVYYAFDRNLNGTSRTLADFPKTGTINIGVDFNVGAMSGIVCAVENGVIYAVDELIGAYNTEALVEQITSKYPGRTIMIYPDSSGSSASSNSSVTDIQILRRIPNVKIHFNSKNPLVRDRIGAVNAMICNGLKERKFLVNVETCPKLTIALEQQGYDDRGQPDKSSGLDHALDAVGYFVYFRYPIQGLATVRQIF